MTSLILLDHNNKKYYFQVNQLILNMGLVVMIGIKTHDISYE